MDALPAPEYGVTALQSAAIGGYIGIVRFLLDKGADANAAAAKKQGRTVWKEPRSMVVLI